MHIRSSLRQALEAHEQTVSASKTRYVIKEAVRRNCVARAVHVPDFLLKNILIKILFIFSKVILKFIRLC